MPLFGSEPLITRFGVSLGILVIGVLLLRDGARWLTETLERRAGPSVLGRIVSSRLVDRPSVDEDGAYGRAWDLEVVYEYRVGGRLFMGTRVAATPTRYESWWRAMWRSRKYELGATVRVYFDPAAPDRAILDPALTVARPWIFVLAGVACVIVGAGELISLAAGR